VPSCSHLACLSPALQFLLQAECNFCNSTLACHPFIVKRGIHCVVRSRPIRLYALQVSSVIRIIDPLTLKWAICMKRAFLYTMGIKAIFMIVIIMITDTILKSIITLQIIAILFASEVVIIPLSRSCLIAIIHLMPVIHFRYGPTRLVMEPVSLILHPPS
jgi:hypothetical protein